MKADCGLSTLPVLAHALLCLPSASGEDRACGLCYVAAVASLRSAETVSRAMTHPPIAVRIAILSRRRRRQQERQLHRLLPAASGRRPGRKPDLYLLAGRFQQRRPALLR